MNSAGRSTQDYTYTPTQARSVQFYLFMTRKHSPTDIKGKRTMEVTLDNKTKGSRGRCGWRGSSNRRSRNDSIRHHSLR